MAPTPSTLNSFRIGGSATDQCGEPISTRVELTLISTGDRLLDPTNQSIVASGNKFSQTYSDGCWCTCPIFPNSSTVDPNQALTPNTSFYRLKVIAGKSTVIETDLHLTLEQLQAAATINLGGDCGAVINVLELLPVAATVPPSNDFCDAVAACGVGTTSAFSFITNADGSISISHNDGLGNTAGGTIPPPSGGFTSTFSFTQNADGSIDISHSDGNGNTNGGTIPAPCCDPATTEQQGLVELATPTEAIDGTDGQVVVTPETLTAVLEDRGGCGLVGDDTTGPFIFPHGVTGVGPDEDLIIQVRDTLTRQVVDYAQAVNDETNITVTTDGTVVPVDRLRVTWVKAGHDCEPANPTPAPVIISEPVDQCADEQVTLCAECVGGVTSFQQLINGVFVDV